MAASVSGDHLSSWMLAVLDPILCAWLCRFHLAATRFNQELARYAVARCAVVALHYRGVCCLKHDVV